MPYVSPEEIERRAKVQAAQEQRQEREAKERDAARQEAFDNGE
jgi:hypothetical protein